MSRLPKHNPTGRHRDAFIAHACGPTGTFMKEVVMTARSIPSNPSIEFDRKQAKVLLDAARERREPQAIDRFQKHHPRFRDGVADPQQLALHDAQLVIAREYGFASWPRWMQF